MTLLRTTTTLVLAGLVSACGNDLGELRGWMQSERARAKPMTVKVEPPKQFAPFRYAEREVIDPFSIAKITAMLPAVAASDNELQPDFDRKRDPLESVPLDSIRMVGHMRKGVENVALLQVDKLVYRVGVGEHVGQNFGKIMRISENEVQLKEMVQDAAGDWVHRDTALQLQGGKQ
ncbi:MAG: pilus assembly protein PilP [Burkholderiales bacterium]|nr:MAG: pilus assembly protein PilP [Burkholderiales bacterium]